MRAVPFRSRPPKQPPEQLKTGRAWCKAHKSVTPVNVGAFFYCPREGCTRKTTRPNRA